MNQVLGRSAGNGLEMREAIDFLTGRDVEPRLCELTLVLAAHMLCLGRLAPNLEQARSSAEAALTSGRAAELFARMVAGLGGPRDVLADAGIASAPVQRDLPAPRAGVLAAMDTRALGLAVVALGGGRRKPGDALDLRVGFSHVAPLGTRLMAGQPMLRVHAASQADAQEAVLAASAALQLSDADVDAAPLIHDIVRA
ncbi:MAG: hypothetical protein HY021_04360 [Burkholderiales bacterium]|nr:hypothetical protein [Burkholderiales bacterium]